MLQVTQEIPSSDNNSTSTIVDASNLVTDPLPDVQIVLATSSSLEDIPPPKADYYAPPPYEVATQGTKLPTYEEVQREKNLEEQDITIPINSPAPRVSFSTLTSNIHDSLTSHCSKSLLPPCVQTPITGTFKELNGINAETIPPRIFSSQIKVAGRSKYEKSRYISL